MEEAWQNAFGQMTYGIYVLTTRFEETVNGMIASWVTQVSYEPPLLIAAVHPNRYSHQLLEKSGHFALHVIAREQKAFLARFKGPDAEKKFDGIDWENGKMGAPVLKSCMAWFECEIIDRYQPGNHSLFVGKVVNADVGNDGTALCTLDYEGMYTGKK